MAELKERGLEQRKEMHQNSKSPMWLSVLDRRTSFFWPRLKDGCILPLLGDDFYIFVGVAMRQVLLCETFLPSDPEQCRHLAGTRSGHAVDRHLPFGALRKHM